MYWDKMAVAIWRFVIIPNGFNFFLVMFGEVYGRAAMVYNAVKGFSTCETESFFDNIF